MEVSQILMNNVKKYLIEKERRDVRRANKPQMLFFGLVRLLAAVILIAALTNYVRTLLFSRREPDYLLLGGAASLCILLVLAATVAEKHVIAKSTGHIDVIEKRTDEIAYIKDNILILSNDTGELRFELSRIFGIESIDGKTTFSYYDPNGGITTFSCLDYYEPQIAKQLYDKGVR